MSRPERKSRARKPKKKLARYGSYDHECNPGPNWHAYDGDRLAFTLGRRWASRIFIAPHLSERQADEALGLTAYHLHAVDTGQTVDLGDGWEASAHRFRGVIWVVAYDSRKRCAYIARPSDFNRAMGLRIWTVFPGGSR